MRVSPGLEENALDVGVELSLYPFASGYSTYIHALIERLRADARLRVETSSMSTQVFGSYEDVMLKLQAEMKTTFEELSQHGHRAVFVIKVLGPLPAP
jgi:uncharacterized protein YqgV (UPF0045/DUF77 family)